MKFLDLNGLTHFFGKVKTWAGNNYLSLKGGSIDGSVVINNEEAVALRVLDGSSYSDKEVTISPTRITMSYTDEDQGGDSSIVYNLDIHDGNITAKSFTRIGGTATQVLIANGSVREIGSANGIAGLDANGNVPLAQLGNLDTIVAEVVTALPTTNIKKHIYLIKDTGGVTQNQYEEYIYTGDTSATYDASKWEKLGDFRATVDLVDYYTKSQVDNIANGKSSTSHTHSVIINGITKTIAASGGTAVNLGTYLTSHQSLAEYAKKIETVSLNEIRVDEKVLTITPQGQTLNQVISFSNFNGNIIEVAFKDATSNMSGFMSIRDKNKLDTIASGATADSAITTAEIDALFA